MKQVESAGEIYQLFGLIKDQQLGFLTNFFPDVSKLESWIKTNLLLYDRIGNCFFLKKINQGFSNIFFIAPDTNALQSDMQSLVKSSSNEILVAEVIAKGGDQEMKDIFRSIGFQLYTTLVRMSRIGSIKATEIENDKLAFANHANIPAICKLFSDFFDPLCEQIPSELELSLWIKNKNLVIYRGGKHEIEGFVIFEKRGQTAHLKYWFVHPECRELGIGSILLNSFFSANNNCDRHMFWVIDTNENAIKRYEHFGFKKELMFDNVYINRAWEYGRKNN
jgi:ribosomal protein S18 acetylase RimI-like enzyme